jgi:hypothetical protein
VDVVWDISVGRYVRLGRIFWPWWLYRTGCSSMSSGDVGFCSLCDDVTRFATFARPIASCIPLAKFALARTLLGPSRPSDPRGRCQSSHTMSLLNHRPSRCLPRFGARARPTKQLANNFLCLLSQYLLLFPLVATQIRTDNLDGHPQQASACVPPPTSPSVAALSCAMAAAPATARYHHWPWCY